jgi:1,4-alpha-glucan branching enzyme
MEITGRLPYPSPGIRPGQTLRLHLGLSAVRLKRRRGQLAHAGARADLILYEVNIAELGGDLERIRNLLAYLGDLGVNAIEVMPLSNVAVSVDWGYLPIGYFGVDERFGKRFDFQQLVNEAYQRGIAVIVDAVYGHTGAGHIRSISLNTLRRRIGRCER